MGNLLDGEFIDEEIPFPEMETVKKPEPGEKGKEDFEVEIVDDTPEPDKGKRVADTSSDDPLNEDEEEIKNYSEKFQKRLKKETAKFHQERRAKEEMVRQLDEATNHLKRIMTENNNLKNVVESGEQVLIGEHKARLEGQLAAARAAYREASEAGDTNGIIAAQENLAKAVSALDRVSGHRTQAIPRENFEDIEKKLKPAPVQSQEVQPSARAMAWREKNQWFDTDVPMASYALGFHKHLTENEGVTPDTDEYFQRIDREMRKRFPDRFAGEPPPRREGSVVAPATRQSSTAPRKVTLTESQVRLARRLGLTPQQYAEQIVEESKNDGKDFTHRSR